MVWKEWKKKQTKEERISPRFCWNNFQFVQQSVKFLCVSSLGESLVSLFSLIVCAIVNILINLSPNSIWLLCWECSTLNSCICFSNDIRWLKESCRFIQDSIACNFIWMPFVSRYFNKLPAEGNRRSVGRSFSCRQWWWWKRFGLVRFRSRNMEENNRISVRGTEEAIYCHSVASLSDSLCQISNHNTCIRPSGAGYFVCISACWVNQPVFTHCRCDRSDNLTYFQISTWYYT